jgi:hypothetical protein
MTEELHYLEDRIESQRKWHSHEATVNKKRYYFAETVALVAGASIPVINVLNVMPGRTLQFLSASLAAIIVISSGISKLLKYQENWLNYRALAEALKREKELYLYKVGDYDREDDLRDKILIERVENLLGTTTSQFISIHRSEPKASQVKTTRT